MSRIYTHQLLVISWGVAADFTEVVGTPGNQVVIRSMAAFQNGPPFNQPGGLEITDSDSVILWRLTAPYVRSQTPYVWNGTQVLKPDHTLKLSALEGDWNLWVSGWDMTPSSLPI